MVATLWIADAVVLAIVWPRPAEADSTKSRWALSGALAGALAGLPIAALMPEGPGPMSAMNLPLAGSVLGSMVIAGALVGGGLFRLRTRAGHRLRFSLRTLLLLPFVLTPLFVALLPVFPYQASVSTTSPFSFVVVDAATGRPIPNAAVRLIDPRFPLDDTENQGAQVVTTADGSAEYFLYANVQGWEGLLGDRLTAPPLGLTYPPPSSVTIRLNPSTSAAGAEDMSDHHPNAP
jgi:hypothetical protein